MLQSRCYNQINCAQISGQGGEMWLFPDSSLSHYPPGPHKNLILSLGTWSAGQFSHRTVLATSEQCGESVWDFREDVEWAQMRVYFWNFKVFFFVQLILWAKFRARAGFGQCHLWVFHSLLPIPTAQVPSSHCLEFSSLPCNNSFVCWNLAHSQRPNSGHSPMDSSQSLQEELYTRPKYKSCEHLLHAGHLLRILNSSLYLPNQPQEWTTVFFSLRRRDRSSERSHCLWWQRGSPRPGNQVWLALVGWESLSFLLESTLPKLSSLIKLGLLGE